MGDDRTDHIHEGKCDRPAFAHLEGEQSTLEAEKGKNPSPDLRASPRRLGKFARENPQRSDPNVRCQRRRPSMFEST